MTKRPVPTDSVDESTEKSSRSQDFASIDTGETLLRPDIDSLSGLSGEHLPPLPGGRYEVDLESRGALLGRGGQGTVWRAYDKVLRREVALKKLHSDALSDPATVSAFLREARLTALLEHPGIVPIHDVGRDASDGSLYLALRLIGGKSLADTLAAANGLDGRLALVPALVRACQAVAFAHERGVVHRDLKPQNIMLGRFGETYVLDWGLALVESRAGAPDVTAPHQATGVVGTPAYMSPEQALGLAADARSDVWGLGACLYHLLTGQAPITGRSLKSAMGHASQGEVSPVLAVEPLAPADLAAICEKALSQERSLRYENASAMAKDLEAWLAGRTVSARTYSRSELLRRALFANRRVLAFVGLALVVLGSVLGFDELRVRRERNEARTFVRELIRELPRQVDAARPNIELINALTTRTQKWLGRSDLSTEEMEEACAVLTHLASVNADISSWAASRELYDKALELSALGQARQPGNPHFVACEVNSMVGLGFCDTERGDAARGMKRFQEASARLASWTGDQSPAIRLARSELDAKWGGYAWGAEPERGRALFIEAAETVLPLLDSPTQWERRTALRRGANAVTATWAGGRLKEAVALSKRFYDAAAPECADQSLGAQRTCLTPASSYAAVAAWVDAPDALAAQELTLKVEAFVHSHDVDSNAAIYDAMVMYLELGLYAESTHRARQLRESGDVGWARDVGPLAAVLAGDFAEVDAWEPLPGAAFTGAPLALGFRDVSLGHYASAARHLRAVKPGRVWYDIAWTPHPRPRFEVPPEARPAWDRFLTNFTRQYREADMEALDATIAAFATELEAL
jgi:eukaryotic-like serine/threonine-protein kinase